jgi:hypothetical protein
MGSILRTELIAGRGCSMTMIPYCCGVTMTRCVPPYAAMAG